MAKTAGKVELFRPGQSVTFRSTTAITAGRIVEVTGDRLIAVAGASSLLTKGWAMQGCDASGAEDIPVLFEGVVPCVASGAVGAGVYVRSGAGGTVVALAADGDPRLIVGKTLAAAADGLEVPVKLI
jgi:hypothetical protein